MKRLFSLFIIAILLSTFSVCHADNPFVSNGIMTKLGWDVVRYYNHATTKITTVYADSALTRPITTVPYQTFVRPIHQYGSPGPWIDYGFDENGKALTSWHVDYIIYPSGNSGSGWIDGRVISECYVRGKGGLSEHLLLIKCGTSSAMDDLPSSDPQWGNLGKPNDNASNENQNNTSPAATKAPSSTKIPSAPRVTATPEPVIPTVSWQGMEITIDVLGSYESEITVGDEKLTVLTKELTFASDSDESERLAIINAPRTGKAVMREKPSKTAKMIKNCKAGRYALVLEKGKTFSKIYYNNAEGYILTSSLRFCSVADTPYPQGVLSYNGYMNGGTTINVRCKPEGGTFVCGEYPTGTVVQIIEKGNQWTEIEVERIRGYVMNKFLTDDE